MRRYNLLRLIDRTQGEFHGFQKIRLTLLISHLSGIGNSGIRNPHFLVMRNADYGVRISCADRHNAPERIAILLSPGLIHEAWNVFYKTRISDPSGWSERFLSSTKLKVDRCRVKTTGLERALSRGERVWL
jgi:hypothetical protein